MAVKMPYQITKCSTCKGKGYITVLENGKDVTINCTKCGGCQQVLIPIFDPIFKNVTPLTVPSI